SGNPIGGFSGDGGPATSALLNFSNSIWVDPSGNLLIADTSNNVIRSTPTGPLGIITTVVGNSSLLNVTRIPPPGFSGDGGPATSAQLNFPLGVTTDTAGNIYIADSSNNVVRKVTKATGIITTVAGNTALLDDGGTPESGYTGDGGPATAAQLNF